MAYDSMALYSILFWSVPFITAVVFSVVLGYLSYKEKSKRKAMFALAVGVSSVGYLENMLQMLGTVVLGNSYRWAFMPMATAIHLAALYNFLKLKNFERLFKGFLLTLFAYAIILPMHALYAFSSDIAILPYSFLLVSSFFMLTGVYARNRDFSDLMFFGAFLSLAFSSARILEEFAVLLAPLGIMFIGLMFATSKNSGKENLSSFIVLERKLRKTQDDLKTTQEKLLKAERLAAIGELAAMVGHDLRNPLTGIKSAVYYIRIKVISKLGDKEKEMLDLIDADISRSDKIINDLLDYSGEVKLELKEEEPRLLVEQALLSLKVPENVQVRNLVESKPLVRVAADRVKRVFINLMTNAIEAMPRGGTLTIRSKKEGNNLEITFADTGCGIPKEIVEKLWTPLVTTKAKGMGFGLPICKRFIEAHGGTISVKSTSGKGTTFTVTIPIGSEIQENEETLVNMPEFLLTESEKNTRDR
jgi:signal transduction histidine kinase